MDLVNKTGLIHAFHFSGQTFLFDSTTNSLFLIDSATKESIHDLDQFSDELQELKKAGYFQPPVIEPIPDTRCFKSLCFMMTNQCNFACSYCFEEKSNPSLHSMSSDSAMKALRWISRLSPERKNIEIDFFGGEPLLVFNQVKEIIVKSKELSKETGKQYVFSLTTNASLLTQERLNFLNQHDISLIISLDGEESIHNHFRKYTHQQGTFKDVLPAIQRLILTRKSGYYIRGTYTHQTLSFADQVIWMVQQGIKKISFEPVVSANPEIGIREEDLPRIRDEYEKLAVWTIAQKKKDPDFSFYHFELDLQNGVCIEKLLTSCGAGVEYLSFSPDGNVYPCHQFDGIEQYCLGNVNEQAMNLELVETFRKLTHISNKTACQNCWAKYLCGGGCIANNLVMNQSLEQPYSIACEIQKMRLEAALFVQGNVTLPIR